MEHRPFSSRALSRACLSSSVVQRTAAPVRFCAADRFGDAMRKAGVSLGNNCPIGRKAPSWRKRPKRRIGPPMADTALYQDVICDEVTFDSADGRSTIHACVWRPEGLPERGQS